MQNVIYRINNVVTDGFYIGSAVNFGRRRWEHLAMLKKGAHHCSALQAAYDEYGGDALAFEVVQTLEPGQKLAIVEDMWLLRHTADPLCYNILHTTTMGASAQDASVREQIAATLRKRFAGDPTSHPRYGTQHTEATKARISENRKGKMVGVEHYRYGRTVSPEVRKKIGDAQRGAAKAPRTLTEEGKARIRAAAALGHYSHPHVHTDATKAKLSKPILEQTSGRHFSSLTAVLAHYDMHMPTLRRALKTGAPVLKGPHKGLRFVYAGAT